jgi:uncharacterized protein YuzE
MKISYDPTTDSACIRLSDKKYKSTKKVPNDILIDYNSKNNPLGIEILSVKENIPSFNTNEVSLFTIPKV